MNVAALRLAASRGIGFRRWPYGAHGNGNWLEFFAHKSGAKVRWPSGPNLLTGYRLPRKPEWADRKMVKRKLRAWLKHEAVYEGSKP